MNKGYEITQGVFSWIALLAFGVALPFSLEAMGILNSLSYDFYVFDTALIAGSIFALAIAVKLAMGLKENKFIIRLNLANWFYSMSIKLDPRRK